MVKSTSDAAKVEHFAAFVYSADGTRIGYNQLGHGPAVVFVHGSVSTHTDWMPVARLLSHRFTCLVMDRRGRGHSGAGHAPYSLDRECEDIAAVLGAASPDASLVAHSYGAICSLEYALRVPVHRLAIYEPPLNVGGPIAGEYLAPYAEAIARGDLDAALDLGLAHFPRMAEADIRQLRESRAWPRLHSLAPTWTRELEIMDALDLNLERYRAIACPILLMAGSESPEHPMKDAARALAAALPGIQFEVLPGQEHTSIRTAPAVVAPIIERFLLA